MTTATPASSSSSLELLPWTHVPANGTSAVNAALLTAAKSLLRTLYGSPAADYLPSSYNAFNGNSSYVVHAKTDTSVTWPTANGSQVLWTTQPTKGNGWSGTVEEAALVNSSATAQCATDCSGFITSLFAYVNLSENVSTAFTDWKQNSAIPEAGCWDPTDGCKQPNHSNYYSFFVSNTNGFQQISSLDDIQPGDILAWANTGKPTDSGHVMLIVAVTKTLSGDLYAIVADESSGHDDDTRTNPDVGWAGLGIIGLAPGSNGNFTFYWKASDIGTTNVQPGPAAVGRAQTA